MLQHLSPPQSLALFSKTARSLAFFFAFAVFSCAPPQLTSLCDTVSCQNGGSCVVNNDEAQCDCPATHQGARCETSILPPSCSPNPCQNNGSCSLEEELVKCTCAGGYTGEHCEMPPPVCTPNPCLNGGSCAEDGNGFSCTCVDQYQGPTCAVSPSPCAPSPCQNGGSCSIEGETFACLCAGGHTGNTCQTPPPECSPNPCQNGGLCSSDEGATRCECPLAFFGETCTEPSPVGLNERPSNSSCIAPPRASSNGPLAWDFQDDWSGLNSLDLMMVVQAPSGHWYEAYRQGQVYVVDAAGDRAASAIVTVPALTDGEMGLLGITLHPDFLNNPYLYLYYQNFDGLMGNVMLYVDRYTVSQASSIPTINPDSRLNIFEFDREAPWVNHIGGSIEFNPQAAGAELFLAIGDGGGNHSVCNNPSPLGSDNGSCLSQYDASFHGKLLRFDLSDTSGGPYTPEIVAKGLRNPFRWSFDRQSGDLWIADVGENSWEEVNHVPAAQIPSSGNDALNFGWPCFEGFASFATGTICADFGASIMPIHTYPQSIGVSIIGGRVYRGGDINDIDGAYFFNDIFPQNGDPGWQLETNPAEVGGDITDDYLRVNVGSNGGFVGYAEDLGGELYALTTWGGIYKLSATGGGPPVETMPTNLSDTGCFDASGDPSTGLIPYEPIAPLWSDNATKNRWLAIPDGSSITLDSDGDFEFPNGSILAKEFVQDGVRVETRLFAKHPDGTWAGYTYAWMDEAGLPLDDAELLSTQSATRDIPSSSLDWQFPSRGQCLVCHTQAANFSLGLEVAQLNTNLSYASTGTSANQIHTLNDIGVITSDITSFGRGVLASYEDLDASVEEKAKAYFHSNCSSCHRPGGSGFGGRSTMPDLQVHLSSPDPSLASLLCGIDAGADTLGLGPGAQLVEPGLPGTWDNLGAGGSVLYLRMAARENIATSEGQMPPIGSREVDDVHGRPLVEAWINSLSCP